MSRYQTHITIVDDAKVARASQSVKVWADRVGAAVESGTVVRMTGSRYSPTPARRNTRLPPSPS